MASTFLSGWNPINAFPDYHGPYAVGTVDVEIPAADLPAPCEVPEGAQPTIAFRIFYPCARPSSNENNRPVRWVPQPQRLTVAAMMVFLGMKERMASTVSYLTQHLYWIRLHAYRNARILDPPTSNRRWPVTMFSHGLAGSRNAYSYVCGDLASNGMIVIALDHRDGSSPVQYVRETAETEARVVYSTQISHEPTASVYQARDRQLRIRLWEMSMAYEALMKIDAGQEVENLDRNTSQRRKERVEVLRQSDGKFDIHRAGKVSWCGHSFGAVTIAQLLKSTYYSMERPANAGRPLIVPKASAAILHQIVPDSPTLLLDVWGLPLQSPDQSYLWDRPLPSYAIDGPQGQNVLSVLSEAFNKWNNNLTINKHIVAAPTRSRKPTAAAQLTREKDSPLPAWARLRDISPSDDSGYASQDSRSPARTLTRHSSRGSAHSRSPRSTESPRTSPDSQTEKSDGPHIFFVQRSQHFNQSDFGILFPGLAKRFAKAEEPERILELNTRAMVQVLREAGVEVAGEHDREILQKNGDIRRWISIAMNNEDQVTSTVALHDIDRKPSVGSMKGTGNSNDGMNMGKKMEPQLEL